LTLNGAKSDLATVSVDGQSAPVTLTDNVVLSNKSWSLDGTHLIFSIPSQGDYPGVRIVSAGGGTSHRLCDFLIDRFKQQLNGADNRDGELTG
jgi:hypothetical protein